MEWTTEFSTYRSTVFDGKTYHVIDRPQMVRGGPMTWMNKLIGDINEFYVVANFDDDQSRYAGNRIYMGGDHNQCEEFISFRPVLWVE